MSDKTFKPSPSHPDEDESATYAGRSEEELQALRNDVQRAAFGAGVNYVALPDEGHDVEGIWFNFPADSRSGYATASYGLCHALDQFATTLQLIPHRGRPIDPDRFPEDRKAYLDKLIRGKVGQPQLIVVATAPTEAIAMGGPITIPWTTQEGDRINPQIAARLNDPRNFQRVWAKSDFAKASFVRSGVDEDRVDVVPPCLFFPELFREGAADTYRWDAVRAANPAPPPIRDTPFRFGYCATWLPRKGHEDLLRAYFGAFSRDENVLLEIKTSPLSSYQGLSHLRTYIEEVVQTARAGLTEPRGGWPRVRFELGTDWSDVQMMEWIASLDCFANASYGEGTGIPQTWALGLGIPLVSTMFGGVGETLALATPSGSVSDGSYIVPHHLVPCSPEMQRVDAIWDASVQWGEYDPEAFGAAMREAFANYPLSYASPIPGVGHVDGPTPQTLDICCAVQNRYDVHGVAAALDVALAKTTASSRIRRSL